MKVTGDHKSTVYFGGIVGEHGRIRFEKELKIGKIDKGSKEMGL